MNTTTTSTLEIGTKLVEYFNSNQHEKIYAELYSPDVVSTEASGDVAKGMDGINSKNEWWMNTYDVKSCTVEGPWPNGDQFILTFNMTTVEKATGKESTMKEGALYTVKDGKVVDEKFFYTTG
jgi:hypothetical protein